MSVLIFCPLFNFYYYFWVLKVPYIVWIWDILYQICEWQILFPCVWLVLFISLQCFSKNRSFSFSSSPTFYLFCFFTDSAFVVISRKSLSNPKSWRFSHFCSSSSVIVLDLDLWSIMSFCCCWGFFFFCYFLLQKVRAKSIFFIIILNFWNDYALFNELPLYLGKNNQLTTYVWIYYGLQYFSWSYLSKLKIISNCPTYDNFIISLKSGRISFPACLSFSIYFSIRFNMFWLFCHCSIDVSQV